MMVLLLALVTVAFIVTLIYWHIACIDFNDLHGRFISTCEKAKHANDRATAVIAEFDKLEAKYMERCKELRDIRRQVSESILSLAESSKDSRGLD